MPFVRRVRAVQLAAIHLLPETSSATRIPFHCGRVRERGRTMDEARSNRWSALLHDKNRSRSHSNIVIIIFLFYFFFFSLLFRIKELSWKGNPKSHSQLITRHTRPSRTNKRNNEKKKGSVKYENRPIFCYTKLNNDNNKNVEIVSIIKMEFRHLIYCIVLWPGYFCTDSFALSSVVSRANWQQIFSNQR